MAFALTEFTNYHFNLSVCASSRVTMWTGTFARRHGVTGNSLAVAWSDAGGFTNALPKWVQTAGYKTSILGKLLNRVVTDNYVCIGVDDGRLMVDDSYLGGTHAAHVMSYVNPFVNMNGVTSQLLNGNNWSDPLMVGYTTAASDARIAAPSPGYQTDNMQRRTLAYLDAAAVPTTAYTEPFYLEVATWAPHGDGTNAEKPIPSARHAAAVFTATRDPSWNEADVTDKPKWLRDTVPNAMTTAQQTYADETDIEAKRTVLAVDELLYDLVRKLDDLGMTERTDVFICADNGANTGQHRLTLQTALSVKNVPYRASTHSRLFVHRGSDTTRRHNVIVVKLDDTGPHVFAAMTYLQSKITATNAALIGNVDLCPTICEITGARPTIRPDGMSILPLLTGAVSPANFRSHYLVEYDPADGASIAELPKFDALVSLTEKYVRYSALGADPAEDEHYTLTTDADELTNDVASLTAAQKASLNAKVAGMVAG